MILGAHPVKTDAGVMRLQSALQALGQKHGDRALLVDVDGVVGPKTVSATTRALGHYVVKGSGVIPQNWIRGTSSSIIRASAGDIAQYIEEAAGSSPYVPSAASPSAPPPQQAAMFPVAQSTMVPSSGGEQQMFPQQQAYYPQQQPGYYPQPRPRGPGGLPTNQATLDVKAFIPAQYDHVSLHPGGAIAIIAIGVLAAMVISQHKKNAK